MKGVPLIGRKSDLKAAKNIFGNRFDIFLIDIDDSLYDKPNLANQQNRARVIAALAEVDKEFILVSIRPFDRPNDGTDVVNMLNSLPDFKECTIIGFSPGIIYDETIKRAERLSPNFYYFDDKKQLTDYLSNTITKDNIAEFI